MCVRIRRAMDAGVTDEAQVLERRPVKGRPTSPKRRDTMRRASSVEIDDAIRIEVERRLDEARDAIAGFHGVPLDGREGAGFIRYPDGGHYKPHRDRAVVASWPGAAHRKIAVVVFLNSGGFTGGTLRVFLDASPVDVQPKAGLLVAFPAAALHEVTTVRGGVRDAIVDWFTG